MTTKRSAGVAPARSAKFDPNRLSPTKPASIKPIALSAERRALIESQVAALSATARKVAAALPLSADVSDFVRVLDEAGSA